MQSLLVHINSLFRMIFINGYRVEINLKTLTIFEGKKHQSQTTATHLNSTCKKLNKRHLTLHQLEVYKEVTQQDFLQMNLYIKFIT